MTVEGPVTPFAQLRAEARRDLRAMLGPSAAAEILIVGTALADGSDALWPIWGTIGVAIAVLIALGVWASFIRGWRVLRQVGRT